MFCFNVDTNRLDGLLEYAEAYRNPMVILHLIVFYFSLRGFHAGHFEPLVELTERIHFLETFPDVGGHRSDAAKAALLLQREHTSFCVLKLTSVSNIGTQESFLDWMSMPAVVPAMAAVKALAPHVVKVPINTLIPPPPTPLESAATSIPNKEFLG